MYWHNPVYTSCPTIESVAEFPEKPIWLNAFSLYRTDFRHTACANGFVVGLTAFTMPGVLYMESNRHVLITQKDTSKPPPPTHNRVVADCSTTVLCTKGRNWSQNKTKFTIVNLSATDNDCTYHFYYYYILFGRVITYKVWCKVVKDFFCKQKIFFKKFLSKLNNFN